MENFLKINALFKELSDELETLKKDLENDINYSVGHAEIVTMVEDVEENLGELLAQVKDVENDLDTLNDGLETDNSKGDIDDDD